MDETETERLQRREAQVKLAIVLVQLAVLGWMLVPPHTRKLWAMRLAAGSGRLLGSAARRSGHASMGTELATGQEAYQVPLGLSLARDRMARAYEKLRDS